MLSKGTIEIPSVKEFEKENLVKLRQKV